MKGPKNKVDRVWIKAQNTFWAGNITACLIRILPPLTAFAGCVWVVVGLVRLAIAKEGVQHAAAMFVGAVAATTLGWWLLSLVVTVFVDFFGKFYVTVEERDQMMKIHKAWCDACKSAEEHGLPEPKRPY